MASLYKRKRDSRKKRAAWFIGFTDHTGKRRTVKGFTDRGETEQLAAKLENEAMLRRRGLIDPAQEQIAGRKKQPIEYHLVAFERSMAKTTAKHVKLTMTRVRRVVADCGFENVGDIDPEEVAEFLVNLGRLDDLGHRTSNHYLQAFGAFCNWAVDTKRLLTNPITSLEPLNAEVDIRHQRRALTAEEVQQLVASARDSAERVQGYGGEQRARIYSLSYLTGFRRKEIASLTPRSFDLDGNPPTVTIEAACSKHRKTDVLPLHEELVALLRQWLKGVPADQLLFPKLANRKTWLMVKKDLERVGIPYETLEGIADFHAAGRHSYITGLVRAGVPLHEAQKLARHADIRMLMRYTHVGMEDRAKAVQALPWQRSGSVSDVRSGHLESPGDATKQAKPKAKKRQNPGGDQGYDANCRSSSSAVAKDEKWRRRELNPQFERRTPATDRMKSHFVFRLHRTMRKRKTKELSKLPYRSQTPFLKALVG